MASTHVHNDHAQEATRCRFSPSGTVVDESLAASAANPHFSPISPPEAREETVGLADNQPATVPEVMPPEHTNRALVLCFDGTGDHFDADNSNIVQLVSLLKKDDKTKQLVYYQARIGTYTSPQIATPFVSKVRKKLDEMFAWNLDAHVMSGYQFLMQNYVTGDSICIFGFSRGAYTACILAGMLHKVGLLPADDFQQVPFVYKMYKRAGHVGWEQSKEFKKAFSVNVQIEFIGVWHTIDAVGVIPKRLPFTTSNTIVKTFRHAVSLDERRAKFKANLWNRPNSEVPMVAKESQADKKLNTLEGMYAEKQERTTDIKEVWAVTVVPAFRSKAHIVTHYRFTDVGGGGSVNNNARHALARIPLRWMVRECFKANTGIMFNSEALLEIGLDPATLYPHVKPRPPPLPPVEEGRDDVKSHRILKSPPKAIPLVAEEKVPFLGSEEEEEIRDAMSPSYDQLKTKKSCYFGSNLARPRSIPKQSTNGFKVHRSVKLRMDVEYEDAVARRKGKKYVPRPHFYVEPTWVD